jgi:hypothetical protein
VDVRFGGIAEALDDRKRLAALGIDDGHELLGLSRQQPLELVGLGPARDHALKVTVVW